MNQLKLPNGEIVYCIDKLTALYVYNEIYVDQVYLYGGLEIKDGDIIFDIGGNIGMFSRFISKQAKDLLIFTFEPIPAIFEVLEMNLKGIPAKVKNYNVGLGEKEEEIDITYYPKLTGDSAIVPFDWERKVELYVKNYKKAICQDMPIARIVPKFLRKRVVETGLRKMYQGEKVHCQIRPLSAIMQENNIERIDFMKIDAENYEWQVLAGLNEEDWGKIQQIAMEVHTHIKGGENLLSEITHLLENKNFKVYEGEESRETIMGVYMLYAQKK